jgi:hypothetical protein
VDDELELLGLEDIVQKLKHERIDRKRIAGIAMLTSS